VHPHPKIGCSLANRFDITFAATKLPHVVDELSYSVRCVVERSLLQDLSRIVFLQRRDALFLVDIDSDAYCHLFLFHLPRLFLSLWCECLNTAESSHSLFLRVFGYLLRNCRVTLWRSPFITGQLTLDPRQHSNKAGRS
jgi:hypothetical protein